MRIIKNTTAYDTRALRSIICKTHAHMRKLEKRPAPNWKRLRIKISTTSRSWFHAGWATLGGCNYSDDHDMYLGLCRPDAQMKMTERTLCDLVYHELMHTYGYTHAHFTDIPEAEKCLLFPDNKPLPLAQAKPKKAAMPVQIKRYNSALARRAKWRSKLSRAKNALKKVEAQVKYYERTIKQ